MTQRTATIEILVAYFNEIGKILSPSEYRLRTDTPIRYARIKSIFGSWNRMENIVRKHNSRNEKPDDYVAPNDVEDIIAESYRTSVDRIKAEQAAIEAAAVEALEEQAANAAFIAAEDLKKNASAKGSETKAK